MISVRKICHYAGVAYPCNKLHLLHVYSLVFTFTILATYSTSVLLLSQILAV